MRTPAERARDQALRELWDLVNVISYRVHPRALDFEAWQSRVEHIHIRLSEAARDARAAELTQPE